jgi:hypothetical protein
MTRHLKPFTAPRVRVERVASGSDFTLIEIAGALAPYEPPFAPAGLYDIETEALEAAQLHKLVTVNGSCDAASFHTYTPQFASAELVGKQYVFRPWWTKNQLALVTDTSRTWVLEAYPDNGTHAHCELTWELIAAHEGHRVAYRSGNFWVTQQAYETLIRADLYGCRKHVSGAMPE